MQVSWDSEYLEFDDPEIVKYYEFGEFWCADGCHLCIPKAYSPYGNNTCKETVERDVVLYDLDNPETDD